MKNLSIGIMVSALIFLSVCCKAVYADKLTKSQASIINTANKSLIEKLKKDGVRTNLYKFNCTEIKTSKQSKANYVRFQPTFKNVPVANSDFVVCVNSKGKTTLINGYMPKEINLYSIKYKVDKKAALKIIIADLGFPRSYKVLETILTILPYRDENFLAWKIAINSSNGDYIYYINALIGDVIVRYSQLIPVDGRGSGYERSPFRDVLQELNLKYLDGTGYLKGSYAEVLLYNGNYTSVRGAVRNDFNFTAIDTADGIIDEVMAYYHINKVHDYFKGELNFGGLDRQMETVVHVRQDTPGLERAPVCYAVNRDTDNDGQRGEIFVWDGHGIEVEDWMWKINGIADEETSLSHYLRFSREADTFYHEYTHAVMYNILSNREYLEGEESSGVDEAFADYFACTIQNDFNFGEYVRRPFQKFRYRGSNLANPDQYPVPLRDLNDRYMHYSTAALLRMDDDDDLYLRYPEDLEFFYIEDTNEVDWHNASQIISAACWDIREVIGRYWADKIIFESINGLPDNSRYYDAGASIINAANLLIDNSSFGRDKKIRYKSAVRDILIRRGILTGYVYELPYPEATMLLNYLMEGQIAVNSPDIYILDAQPGTFIVDAQFVNPKTRANPQIEIFDEESRPVVNDGSWSSWPWLRGEGGSSQLLIYISEKAAVFNTKQNGGRYLIEVKEPARLFIKIKTNEFEEGGAITLLVSDDIPEYNLGETKWLPLDRKRPQIYSFMTGESEVISVAYRWLSQTGAFICTFVNYQPFPYVGTLRLFNTWEQAYPIYLIPNARIYLIFEPQDNENGYYVFTLFDGNLYETELPDIAFLNALEIPSRVRYNVGADSMTVSFDGEIEIVNQTSTSLNTIFDERQIPFDVEFILNDQVVARRTVTEPLSRGESTRFNMNFSAEVPLRESPDIKLVIDRQNAVSEASEINNTLLLSESE